ncbi:MAG: ATP-dependent 6-phosphofructokinase [bacterium]
MKKRVLVVTGGGDCPGLNAVIRGIVKRAAQEKDYEIFGSIRAFDGVLKDPQEIISLNSKNTSGIHQKGGTIIKTTTKDGPFNWPTKQADGTITYSDRSAEMLKMLKELGIYAVISIGGEGSQKISQTLFEMGLNVIGVPKTIDHDLSFTDMTFGFPTAVQIATDALDKLVTTAESHDRVMILEVMGRNAGWIALYSAIAGGAEVCLLPEIPYNIDSVLKKVESRFTNGYGFCIIIVAEGAKSANKEFHYTNTNNPSAAYRLLDELKAAGMEHDARVTVLGHLQRGGIPIAQDRILATQFGVKAFEMVLEKQFGDMVGFINNKITSVTIKDAVSKYNFVDLEFDIVHTARGVGICLGD